MSLLLAVLAPPLIAAFMLWLTRNDYADGYNAGYFAAKHGMDNDYANEGTR